MILVSILLTIFNVVLIIGAYFFIRRSVQRQVVNRDVLAEIKKEVNSIIININETTMNSVSLIEEKTANLNRLIALADKRAHGLSQVEQQTVARQVQLQRPVQLEVPVQVKEPVAIARQFTIDTTIDEQAAPVNYIDTPVNYIDTPVNYIDTQGNHNDPLVNNIDTQGNHIDPLVNNIDTLVNHIDPLANNINPQFNNVEAPIVKQRTYSPQKVVQQSRLTGEKLLEERRRNEEKRRALLKEVEGLSIAEKVVKLGEKGFTEDEVRRILKMDRGEFEMLLNFENISL